MLRMLHFPWRRVMGLALVVLLILPILVQATAAPRTEAAVAASTTGDSVGDASGSHEKAGGGGGKDTPLVPNEGEGDPDDYGYLPPLIERLLFLLRLIG